MFLFLWDPLGICARGTDSNVPVAWGPCNSVTNTQLESFDWFADLADFTELFGDDDPDGELVPKLVKKCIFPEVERRLRDCWDITSLKQSTRVAALLDECVLFESDQGESVFSRLVDAAIQRLETSLAALVPEVFVSADVLAKWYESSARMRLLWQSCKIACCALQLDGRLPEEKLSHFVLTAIFATRIAPHVRALRLYPKELAVIDRFVAALPQRWLEKGLPNMLVPLRDALGPRAPPGAEARVTAQAAARVLRNLRCFDEAQVIMATL